MEESQYQQLSVNIEGGQSAHASPISLLPFEILSRVFVLCLPYHGWPTMSSKFPPISLGQICKTWRIVSQSTPHLWVSIDIPGYHPWEFSAHGFQEWLRRSGSLPLSFKLSATDLDMNHNIQIKHQSVVDALCELHKRWKRVILKSAGTLHMFPYLENFTSKLRDADILEHLEITAFNVGSIWDFSNARNLTTLNIISGSRLLKVVAPGNGFQSLHTLKLETYASTYMVLRSLCTMIFLVNLDVRIHECAFFGEEIFTVQFPYLTKLACTFDCSTEAPTEVRPSWGQFFSKLQVPILRNFELQVIRYSPGDISIDTILLSHFLRTPQSLLSFEIRFGFFAPQLSVTESLIDCLRFVPNLRRLRIAFFVMAQESDLELVRALTIRNGYNIYHENLCPYLEEIEFSHCRLASKSDILNMIQSRLQPSTAGNNLDDSNQGRLRKILIETVDADTYQTESDFGDISFRGLDFRVISAMRKRRNYRISSR